MEHETLLIVEGAAGSGHAVETSMAQAGYKVSRAVGGRGCLLQLAGCRPAAIILDIDLHDVDGIDVITRLRARSQLAGIVVMIDPGDEATCMAVLDAGADSVIYKPVINGVLLAQIRTLLRRRKLAEKLATAQSLGLFRVDLMRRRLFDALGEDVQLTHGEFALLVGLIEHRGHAVSRSDLLICLRRGQDADDGDSRSVDTLIARLRRKLEPNTNRPMLIQTIYGQGYRLASEYELLAS